MSLTKAITGLLFAILSLVTLNANAALVKVGGNEVLVATVNKYGVGGASSGTPPEILNFYNGANIKDTEGGQYEYTATFLYEQASYNNIFYAPDGQTIDTSPQGNNIISGTFNVESGAFLAFSFGANCSSTFLSCSEVSNGENSESETASTANFAISSITTEGDTTTLYLFLNDTGGGPDQDFDDLIVKLELTKFTPPEEVPEPSTLFLLAISALGVARFKK